MGQSQSVSSLADTSEQYELLKQDENFEDEIVASSELMTSGGSYFRPSNAQMDNQDSARLVFKIYLLLKRLFLKFLLYSKCPKVVCSG